MYDNVIKRFQVFALQNGFRTTLPVPPKAINWFVADMFNKNYSVATARCHLSALAYWMKINGFVDATKSFQVQQILKGFSKLQESSTIKLPLSMKQLEIMVENVPRLGLSINCCCLIRTMLVVGFHLGLRIGEMTISGHNLSIEDISVLTGAIKVVFKSFKHSKAPSTHIVKSTHEALCPYKYLIKYLKGRAQTNGPLFLLGNKGVSSSFFTKVFKQLIIISGFDREKYSPHSLRMSAAVRWARKGFSDNQIRLLGRWSSNAFKGYMKGTVFHN